MNSQEIVQTYFARGYKPVIWTPDGDIKGPEIKGWNTKERIDTYSINDWDDTKRIGLFTGVEVSPGKFLHDVDIDWYHGHLAALSVLPKTDFVYGRQSKSYSHCFYLTSEAIRHTPYRDISIVKGQEGDSLIELRGTKLNGEVGIQTMAPPSIWTKDGLREQLSFSQFGEPRFIESASNLRQSVCLAAIAMLLSKHLGWNGFGHETRLAWAGYLLRLGIPKDELKKMGKGISIVCNNLEIDDVERCIESTYQGLQESNNKIKGGPTLEKILGDNGKRIIQKINEWMGRDSDFIRNKEGIIVRDHQENIKRATELLDVEFSYNTFSEKMLIKELNQTAQTIDDHSVNGLWLRVDREFKFRPTQIFFTVVLKDIAFQTKIHPVKEYLDILKWDGTPRIDEWLIKYGKSPDSEYHRKVAAIVLIAAVRRVRQPGCKYDEMLVLESEQGLSKSSALRALCPNDDWFSDDLPLNVSAQEIIERTLGKWIIEASDMSGGRKADRDHLKAMLSRQTDGPARMAYDRFPIERPRQFIIIGTTNSADYLADPTGARRFWPIRVGKFDVAGIIDDRDQLWAEAAYREKQGESIRLPEHLWSEAGKHQEQRRQIDAWEEILEDYIENIAPSATGRKQIASSLLWEALGFFDINRRDRVGSMRISEIMQRFGFQRTKIYHEGKTVAGYIRDKCDSLDYSQKLDLGLIPE